MTILNVDDDIEDIEIFCEAIRDIDPSIVCLVAKSAEQAFQILNSELALPEYIFLDINMPKVDGNKCLLEIKKDQRLSKIPVVMYSTFSHPAEIEQYKVLEAEFLVKQNNFHDLVSALKKVLGKA